MAAVAVVKATGSRAARESARRLRIAIDMDEVMADALAEHVRRYNTAFGTRLAVDDLHGHHLEDYIPPAHRSAAEALLDSVRAASPKCNASAWDGMLIVRMLAADGASLRAAMIAVLAVLREGRPLPRVWLC